MKRRGRNEGSLYQRPDGRWVASLTIGCTESGRQRRRVVYAKTKGEVMEKLDELKSDVKSGILVDASRMRVASYLTGWLADAVRPSVRPTTYSSYESKVRLHINPHIGGIQLTRLSSVNVQGLMATLERNGVSPRVRVLSLAVLNTAFVRAMEMGLISKNPCKGIVRPKDEGHDIHPLSSDQARCFLAAAKGDRLEALYVLAVTTGLRQGELLGLAWEDIKLGSGCLSVRHTLMEDAHTKTFELRPPKSKSGKRQVELPAVAIDALTEHLKKHREKFGADPHPTRLVFVTTSGTPIRKSNLVRRSFFPLLAKAGLLRIRFHDLRHTAATLLLEQGVNPKIVQERLGHAKISQTLDTYSHTTPGMQKQAAAKMDELFGPRRSGLTVA